MPEYLSPGVYIEETSYRDKSIQGVGTSTAAFIGPTRTGPDLGTPSLLTSYADFQRIYGGMEALALSAPKAAEAAPAGGEGGDGGSGGAPTPAPTATIPNFVAHAVYRFFQEGGAACYVSRVSAGATAGEWKSPPVTFATRFGGARSLVVTLTVNLGEDVAGGKDTLAGAGLNDAILVAPKGGGAAALYWVGQAGSPFKLDPWEGTASLTAFDPAKEEARPLTLSVAMAWMDQPGQPGQATLFTGLALHPAHPRALPAVFPEQAPDLSTLLYEPLVVTFDGAAEATAVGKALLGLSLSVPAGKADTLLTYLQAGAPPADPSGQTVLTGSDGDQPKGTAYLGDDGTATGGKRGLLGLEDLDDVSMVAAPGITYTDPQKVFVRDDSIPGLVIAHCEKMRYRVALLDPPPGMLMSEVAEYRGRFSSNYAAIYYPWILAVDPVSGRMAGLPPSGFLAGVYARNDTLFDVSHAPANLPLRSAQGLACSINETQQGFLNPLGVNCLRFFPNLGNMVWGARTIAADPDWTYVNVRRYLCYLEHSLDRGTQWVVFQNNGPQLWASVVQSVSDFLYNEWVNGRLLGTSGATAFFVRCDRSTMTQADLDNGRLICEVGVSVLKPAEFVIFRIGQWTGSAS